MRHVIWLVIAACGGGRSAPVAPRIGKAVAAALVAADRERVPWRCAALDVPPLPDEQVTTGPRTWQLGGRTVHRVDADPEVVIGVVADAGGAAPSTIAALARLRTRLEGETPDLVISLGGMGTTEPELEATLGTLADHATWPVVALPGDLEAESAQIAATAALRKKGELVIDGRLARWIELPGATIGTVPGAGAAARLVASDDGCGWRAADAAKIYSELAGKPGLRIAALAEAPRSVEGGEPTGEIALVPGDRQVDVVLHAPVRPAPSPARTGVRDGARTLLSPGTADATTRLPASGRPAAGVLVLRGTSWSWRPLVDVK